MATFNAGMPRSLGIYLGPSLKDQITFPVNPEEFGETDERNFEDVVLANGDEKTVVSGRNLRTYSISSFFPKQVKGTLPTAYVKKIKGWMDGKKVLQLEVTGLKITSKVMIRSFEWKEDGSAAPGDIDFTLELKEHRPITYSKIKPTPSKSKPKPPSKRPPVQKEKARTYTVKSGDCLSVIAKKLYGDGSKKSWDKIYQKNKSIIGSNPHKIKPGMKLVIP